MTPPALLFLLVALGLVSHTTTQAQISTDLKPPIEVKSQDEILALQQAGLPYLALTAARANRAALPASLMRDLEADYAAELTRLATITTRQESERFRIADRALAMYDHLIPQWRALGPVASEQLDRIRIDQLQALSARVRMHELIRNYESLQRDGVVLPNYALTHVAAAYLYQRQPEKARQLYDYILKNEEENLSSPQVRLTNQIGLFYSLIETEQHDRAQQVIDDAMHEQAVWVRIKGIPQRQPNPLRFDAEHTAALSYLYAENTPKAQELLTDMVNLAPNNANLRTSLAATYRAREWPRRAQDELKIAESLAPRAITVEAEQIHAAMDLGQWEQAEILLDDLQARAPEHALTRNAKRRWQTHTKAELNISAQRGIISDNPVSGKNDLSMEAVLYSAPLNHNWRPFAGTGYAQSEFEEGETTFRWNRAGIQWRGKGLTAELEGSSLSYGHGTKAGARASVIYDLDDYWQIGASTAFRSIDTPVRALHHNITSNDINATIRWRAHERREWSLSVSASRFSDDNRRVSMILAGRERLYTSPRFKADAELSVYASKNSKRDAPYFNPRSDVEIVPAINLSHMLYRRYETVVEHSLRLGAGVYHQQGYGSKAVGTVGYSMRYQLNNDFDIGASIIGTSRPYDGQREREVRVMLNMNVRF